MKNEDEIWKDVPGYEGRYVVSNLGRVKSLGRTKRTIHGVIPVYEKILIGGFSKKGYRSVRLSRDGFSETRQVHQLVAIAFLAHTRCGMKYVVDHIDNNKLNNHVSNLQITSSRINGSKDRTSASGLTGAYKKSCGVITSQVVLDGKMYYLGSFDTVEEANTAYNKAVKDYEIGIFPEIIHPNVTGYRGVYIKGQKYRATIRIGGRNRQIGYYATPEEAARAYDRKALEFKPRAMRLNFPITDYI